MKPIRRPDTDVMLISRNGIIIRSDAERISLIGRNAQGVRLMNLDEGDAVVAVALCDSEEQALAQEGEQEEAGGAGNTGEAQAGMRVEGSPETAGSTGISEPPDDAEGETAPEKPIDNV